MGKRLVFVTMLAIFNFAFADYVGEDKAEITQSKEKRFTKETQIVPFFLSKYFHINNYVPDLYSLYKVKTVHNDIIFTTNIEYLQTSAKIRQGEVVDTEKARKEIYFLLKGAFTLKKILNRVNSEDEFYSFIESKKFDNINVEKETQNFLKKAQVYNSDCFPFTDIAKIRCGGCIIDYTTKTGYPDLYCNGMAIITSEMLFSTKATISSSSAKSSVRSKSKSTQTIGGE